jgi:release factor glutamine methyltransferase
LLAHALGMEAAALVAAAATIAPEAARNRFEALLARRLAGEPVARIVGRKEFWGLSFRLGPETLVPRPETETLVEAALAAFPRADEAFRLLDLGTGTGALLAAILAERPRASGVGVDRSEAALRAARANLESLGIGARAGLVCGDWGAAFSERFNLVVCNPPYIAAHEFPRLAPEVRDYDPRLALDGGIDGLGAYRAVIADLARLLAPEGVAVLELGRGQESEVVNLTRAAALVAGVVRPDLAGIPRALMLRRRP